MRTQPAWSTETINRVSDLLTPAQIKRLERKNKKMNKNEQPTNAKTERHHQNRVQHLRPIEPLNEKQQYLLDDLQDYDQVLVYGPAGTGKAQPLTSKIMTPNGWKLMGDIKIGDTVLGEDGTYNPVTGIFPQGEQEVYKITFEDGRTAECTSDHLWNIYCHDYPEKNRTINTTELIRKLNKPAYAKRLYIPLVSPTDNTWAAKDLPIHPYVLGIILGDGHISDKGYVNITSDDQDIIDRVSLLLPNDSKISSRINKIEFGICNLLKHSRNGNIIKTTMNELGLNGKKSYDKFIPTQYLNSSLTQRLELLKGLLDTDGYIGRTGDVSYFTTSLIMANQVRELIWSLGGVCKIKSKITTYTYKGEKKSGRIAYNLCIRMKDRHNLVSLPRKLERLSEHYQYNDSLRLRIKTIEKVRIEECQCIMVNSKSHLYVTDNYVVTHNTFITTTYAAQEFVKGNFDKIVITRPTVAIETSIGFFPGTLEEKMSVWLAETINVLKQTMSAEGYAIALKNGDIEIVPFEVIRGRSLNRSIILLTEAQNTTVKEMAAFVTRTGEGSKVIIDGDIRQSDIGDNNGLVWALNTIQHNPGLAELSGMVEFNSDDIVRSGLCGAWVKAIEKQFKPKAEVIVSK